MSSHKHDASPPLDLSRWRNVPAALIGAGGALALIGLAVSLKLDGGRQFAFSWLLAFMFFLSLALGALFLVLVHHLTDAGWSVAIRRFCEHLAALLFPWLAILFLPVAFFAKHIYSWMTVTDLHANNLLTPNCRCSRCPDFASRRRPSSASGGC